MKRSIYAPTRLNLWWIDLVRVIVGHSFRAAPYWCVVFGFPYVNFDYLSDFNA